MILLNASRSPRRLVTWLCTLFIFGTVVLWLSVYLPLDSPIILFVRLLKQKTHTAFPDDHELAWIYEAPKFSLNLKKDVAIVIKTGYGTQDRVSTLMEAWGIRPTDENVVVIGDFAGKDGKTGVEIHDMIEPVVQSRIMREHGTAQKVLKYDNLTTAIQNGGKNAMKVSKEVGWELDSMKFISGLRFAYSKIPNRKWYMMVDDDTYIHRPSLKLLLGHLNPSEPYYLGNKLGGWNERFGHGGSSFLLSREAMARLFDRNEEYVWQSYIHSLHEELGDKLVALTFMKVGVYLDERYNDFFNGETPVTTKITADRLCLPFLGFHWLNNRERMIGVADKFRDIRDVVFWHDLWNIYGQPNFETLRRSPIRVGQDHVGREDKDRKPIHGVTSAEGCSQACLDSSKTCIAWTWDSEERKCHIASYFIIGNAPAGKKSGLNMLRMTKLMQGCARTSLG